MEVTRRNLIEMSLAGASAAAIAGSASAETSHEMSPPLPEDEKLGFAIVGIGLLSQGQLIPGLRKAKGARLTALVSGDPAKAARVAAAEGVAPDAIYNYENFDRIVNDKRIDVVYIVLPNSMHAEYTIRALKAGKHVLCEKPMATSIADCEAMIAAAKKADRKLMIAYRLHYEPNNLEAMRQIRAGAIGKPRIVVTDMGRQTDLSQPSDVWRLDMKMSGGGALTDIGIYGINAARYLLNEEPVEVRAWESTDKADPRFKQVPDIICWQFRFPSGVLYNGSTSFSQAGTMTFTVLGEKGRLVADPGGFYGGNKLEMRAGGPNIPALPNIDQFAREMDWMADLVRGKVPNVSDGAEGLQDVRLMEAILESVRKGGAPVKTGWGYKRAFDPATAVPDRW
jgi:glucose-fructose oxidoreductase